MITVRGQKLLSGADAVIYTGFLVGHDLLDWARQDARIYGSVSMDLEQVMEVMEQTERDDLTTVRLHTGDPCLCGVIREQMDGLDARGIKYDVYPGVSSFRGATTVLGMEYTLLGISQSVATIGMTERTPVSECESIEKFITHDSTMVVFLSAGMTRELSEELVKGGYLGDTPAAIVYGTTWPDEKVARRMVAALEEAAGKEGIHKIALTVVGSTVAQTGYERSKLYSSAFTTGFRAGREIVSGKPEPGTLYVMGMGSGEKEQVAGQALEVMGRCQVIAGYTIYVDLVRGLLPWKKFLTIAMTREEKWCRKTFECCTEGKNIAMICSEDMGVYGMASLTLELTQQYPGVRVRIVPGITATCAEAAVLGAPLMHDFAVTSLSDRLTPLEDIWNRVETAAQTDSVMCLYNPISEGRPDFFRQACSRILRYRTEDTVCRLAVNVGREGEGTEVPTLEGLKDRRVDMLAAVYIGNSHTRQTGPYIVMPRGYRCEGN